MKNENKKAWRTALVCFILIGVVLWIFYQYTFEKGEPERQKEISVILYNAGDGGWESLIEGMRQAEDYFSVNINYITLREGADGEEQQKAIAREIENGAEGIILAVCDYEALNPFLRGEDYAIPVIAVESGLNDPSFPLVSADNYAMGKRLAEEILADWTKKELPRVALAQDMTGRDSVEQRKAGLVDALEGKAHIIFWEEAVNGQEADIVVALYKEAFSDIIKKGEGIYRETKIYGIGNTSAIVAALDRGIIEKLVFQNEFNMGYLSVKALLNEIERMRVEDREEIEYYCVTKQELYGTEYEKLLFPIVE